MKATDIYSVQWLTSVNEISHTQWQRCFPEQDILRSYELQKVYEVSNFRDTKFHYCVISHNQKTVAILPCFEYKLSLTDVAGPSLQSMVGFIRKFWPNFLKLSAFVNGSPISICDDLIGVHLEFRSDLQEILKFSFVEIAKKSKDLRCQATLIKEIRNRYQSVLFKNLPNTFIVGESPPTTFSHVGEINGEPYFNQLRNRYRSSIRGYQKKFSNTNLHWKLVSDFGDISEQLCDLYLNVLNKSKVRFEQLTPEFFKHINDQLGDKTSVLLCYHKDQIVAMELIVQGQQMHPIYLGMNYDYLHTSNLYFNCLIKLLQEAQDRNCSTVELGQTSYEAKSNFGIELEKLYVAMQHNHPWINRLIKLFKHQVLPPYQEVRTRNVIKDKNAHSARLAQAIMATREGY